jgi:hypothetical protein
MGKQAGISGVRKGAVPHGLVADYDKIFWFEPRDVTPGRVMAISLKMVRANVFEAEGGDAEGCGGKVR